MSGAAFFRHDKLRGSGIILKAARHNKRAIQSEQGGYGHIDPNRSHLNFKMMGPQTATEVDMLFKQKISEVRIAKTRKNQVLGIEFVFSLPSGHNLDLNQYFKACADWAGAEFGGMTNILSLDVHLDEGQDHAHLLLIPIKDGRLKGSDMMGGPSEFTKRQLRFYESVGRQFGLNKPRGKLSNKNKAGIAKQVLAKLSVDQASKSSVWAVIRDSVERDPTPYALALGIDLEKPEKPEKPMRTSTQIFTSTGKGPKHEDHIGFQEKKPYMGSSAIKPQTIALCRVSSLSESPTKPPPTPEVLIDANDSIRIRDCDLDPNHFDPETGEFHKSPPPAPAKQKAAAQSWVNQALNDRYG